MRAFQRMTIAQKLWLPTIALCVVIAAVFATTGLRTRSAIAQQQKLQADQLAKSEIAQRWSGLTEANAARVVAGLVAPDGSVADALKADVDATSQTISELQKSLDAMAVELEEKQALEAVASTRQAYIAARNEAARLKAAGDGAAALALLNDKVKPAVATYLGAQRGFVKVQQDRVAAMNEAAAAERMRLVLLVGGILAVLAALLVSSTVLLVRSIRQPLRELVAHARRIGEGDLAQALRAERQDEIGEVQTALVQMQDALRRVVGEVRSAADSIQTASAEVATGNHDLSGRTEQAASSLQQTASSMEQLTGTVSQSAESARTANRLAESAAGVASKGGEVVAQVVTTMEAIEAASKRIGDIIGVIDGIAFQTNILALNAAVEAARAGEQGRGFAVVASEVRSLAQRSADAAREIKSLIGASVDKVESGSRLVADAGETMTEIVQSVRHVTDLIAEISTAAGEQNSGIGEINIAVTQLDQMTQQNAALVEQSTAAAESLREQAQRLAQVVARFRLSTADGPALAAVA